MATITEQTGDIFTAPPNSILIHACNARGAWGSGVALSFKQKYPLAFLKYHTHCLSPPPLNSSKIPTKQHQANIVGTTLLIPPPPPPPPQKAATTTNARQPSHYIACLFTSLDYGKRVSPAEQILKNTENALKDLARQIAEVKEVGEEVGGCYAVRINSGRFGVEWRRTRAVLEDGGLDITVVRSGEGEEEDRAERVGAAAGGTLGKITVATSAGVRGHDAAGERARTRSLGEKRVREKRKRKADMLEGDDSGCENAKGSQPAPLHPGIAKRRKKLGLGE